MTHPNGPNRPVECQTAPLSFQARVRSWVERCFGSNIADDRVERGDRCLEEVFELLQSGGYDPSRVAVVRDYVWGRPAGEPQQELGGVMVTLAAYAAAHGLDMSLQGETELARVNQPDVMERVRAKQAAKLRDIPLSPLPQASPHYCAPGDQQHDHFILRFCDNDVADMQFEDEVEAFREWQRYCGVSGNWNGYLFRLARLTEAPQTDPHRAKRIVLDLRQSYDRLPHDERAIARAVCDEILRALGRP